MKNQKTLGILKRRRVGVLYGGLSAERSISLKSGAAVRAALERLGLPHIPIDVDRRVAEKIKDRRIDLAFLALHGPFGEDGCVQGLLEISGIPYTGSGVLASALAMHKPSAKKIFCHEKLPTPRWSLWTKTNPIGEIPFPPPWVVKPASQGSAVGVSVVKNKSALPGALKKALASDAEALVEEYIPGAEITVGILGDKTLPVIEIVPAHAFYDFHSKYAQGGSRHLIPARLPLGIQVEAGRLAHSAFKALGCRHFGRVDLIVPKNGRPTILEINTLPGLTDVSLLPDAARAAGLSFDDLVFEILKSAAGL